MSLTSIKVSKLLNGKKLNEKLPKFQPAEQMNAYNWNIFQRFSNSSYRTDSAAYHSNFRLVSKMLPKFWLEKLPKQNS